MKYLLSRQFIFSLLVMVPMIPSMQSLAYDKNDIVQDPAWYRGVIYDLRNSFSLKDLVNLKCSQTNGSGEPTISEDCYNQNALPKIRETIQKASWKYPELNEYLKGLTFSKLYHACAVTWNSNVSGYHDQFRVACIENKLKEVQDHVDDIIKDASRKLSTLKKQDPVELWQDDERTITALNKQIQGLNGQITDKNRQIKGLQSANRTLKVELSACQNKPLQGVTDSADRAPPTPPPSSGYVGERSPIIAVPASAPPGKP